LRFLNSCFGAAVREHRGQGTQVNGRRDFLKNATIQVPVAQGGGGGRRRSRSCEYAGADRLVGVCGSAGIGGLPGGSGGSIRRGTALAASKAISTSVSAATPTATSRDAWSRRRHPLGATGAAWSRKASTSRANASGARIGTKWSTPWSTTRRAPGTPATSRSPTSPTWGRSRSPQIASVVPCQVCWCCELDAARTSPAPQIIRRRGLVSVGLAG
jgi:hypothetical protein